MRRLLALGLLLSTLAQAGFPETDTRPAADVYARDLMARVDENLNPADEVTEASLLLIHPNGQQKRWRIKQYYQHALENSMGAALLRFLDPSDLRGTTLVSVNQPGGENFEWLYLPAFKVPQIINDNKKTDYIFGSDITFEDYVPYVLDDYAYQWVREDRLDERPATVVRVIPVAPKLVERVAYAYQIVWIDPDRTVLLRADYYDKLGRLIKTSTWSDFVQPDRKHWRARRRMVFSPLRPHWTEMSVESVKIDQGLPSDFFSSDNLTSLR